MKIDEAMSFGEDIVGKNGRSIEGDAFVCLYQEVRSLRFRLARQRGALRAARKYIRLAVQDESGEREKVLAVITKELGEVG